MSKRKKLLEKLTRSPAAKDLTFDEYCNALKSLGFEKTESKGSGFKFKHPKTKTKINAHAPHPENTVPTYIIKQACEKLRQDGLIK